MTRNVTGILVLTLAVLAGCEREGVTTASADARRDASEAKIAANVKAAEDTKIAADAKIASDVKAAAATKNAADDKIAADLKAAAAAKAAADAKIAADNKIAADAKAAADANTSKATSLLVQLDQQIKDKKVELAEATIAQLDGMRESLPASLQDQIDTARVALEAIRPAARI